MPTSQTTLAVFNHVSQDGFFTDAHSDMSWAYKDKPDKEWDEFVQGNASGDGILVFGRKTYEMMASFWPTPMAAQMDAALLKRMNNGKKIVFSKTLKEVSWENTTLIKDDLPSAIKKLKQEGNKPLVVLGSGTIVSQLAGKGLIDEYQLVVNPIILGKGRTLFEGIDRKMNLKLIKTRTFNNGNVMLCYQEA
jgi:dihydrofolate reductase